MLKNHISHEFQNFTGAFYDTWDLLVKQPQSLKSGHHNLTDVPSLDMGTWIDDGPWHGAWEAMLSKMSRILNNMVKVFEDHSISTILRSDRCSVKCRTKDKDAQKWCGPKKDATKLHQSRYCPEEHTLCQVQCHTVKEIDNLEELLHGWDKLKSYALTPGIILQKSWEKHASMGPPNQLMKQIPNYHRSMIALPVCSSPYTEITSFKEHKLPTSKLGQRNRDQAMACHCGDWRGNETRLYMEALNLHPQSPDWQNHKVKEQMEIICPHNLRKLPPASHFLTFCALGIRFPKPGEPAKVRMETHGSCASVHNATISMTEEEANDYFCNEMPERKKIFRHELPTVDALPPLPNHKTMCDRYNHARKHHNYMEGDFPHVDWNH